MRLVRTTLSAAAIWAAFSPGPACGSGYSIYEQGAAALGMAGAATASVGDASALFFNPAAMTRLEGTRFYIGGSVLNPVTSFAGVDPYPGFGVTEEMKRQTFVPPTLYATHRYSSGWAVGAGLNSPFGLGTEWKKPDNFTGRYISTKAELRALNGNLSGAYAFNSKWSVAAGASALFSKVRLENRLFSDQPVPGGGGAKPEVAKAELESDFKPGYGWNAAVSFAPNGKCRLGAYYRSKVVVDVDDGRADFTQIPYTAGSPTFNQQFNDSVAAHLPPDQDVSTVLRFPAMWSAGVSWLPREAWTLEADFNFFEWSVFRDLPIRFKQTPEADKTIPEDYDDSWQIRAGAEHRLPSYTYRFGYYFDRAAAPEESVSPILPDSDRHGATLGFGYGFGPDKRWGVDVYELAIFVKKRSTENVNRDGFDGEYKTFVNAAGVGLAYRW